jgi:hypothetical protein
MPRTPTVVTPLNLHFILKNAVKEYKALNNAYYLPLLSPINARCHDMQYRSWGQHCGQTTAPGSQSPARTPTAALAKVLSLLDASLSESGTQIPRPHRGYFSILWDSAHIILSKNEAFISVFYAFPALSLVSICHTT